MISSRSSSLPLLISFMVGFILATPAAKPQQVSDLVDRLIRNRNPGAVFTTTERADVTWQTLRSITYSPTLGQGAVGSASVQDASLVRSFKNPYASKSGGSRAGGSLGVNLHSAVIGVSVMLVLRCLR